jgi:hypothetical protein
MPEQRTYQGRTREEAMASYHADALGGTAAGYVPIGQEWTEVLGEHTLTVWYEHRPGEVADVLRVLTDQRLASPELTAVALRARIDHYRSQGYRVLAETSTAAQLAKPYEPDLAHRLSFGLFTPALHEGDLSVHLSVRGDGSIMESGTAIDMEREKLGGLSRAQVALIVGLLIVVAVVWLLGDGGMNSFSE